MNTQAFNQYLEYCNRSYGNTTYVGTHNSPFLNDGIRMLQGQTHKVNNTLYNCHTSCDLLNAGTVEDYLKIVIDWMHKNPFEVVTILIGSSDFVDVDEFQALLENSGLSKFAYIPENNTLTYNEAVVFVDYNADEKKIPYLLDEFTYMWETPFSQTDADFPCNIDRPPDETGGERKLYMANHNLVFLLSPLSHSSLSRPERQFFNLRKPALVPNTIEINRTNGVEGFSSLGLQANSCDAMWGRYPNFLLVDFYDSSNSSIFEVAAKVNNVTYCVGIVAEK
ncbi:PLC-like phosphodiesterase [Trichophaea hybrida]|nr:PLC-like phosphodiesterase [Trichophaea hybrida]